MTTEPDATAQTAALPPFTGDDSTCIKCGNVGARTEYLSNGTCVHDGRAILGYARNERLCRQCERCDYRWDEALAEPAKPAADHRPPAPPK